MTTLTKEYFEKHLDKQLKASEKRLKTFVGKKFNDLNQRTARGFTGVQNQINTTQSHIDTMQTSLKDVQKKVTDADLPQIKRDNKLIKAAIGLKTA